MAALLLNLRYVFVFPADVMHSHGGMFLENSYPSSPASAPACRIIRRPSEVSIASQVSGLADSYTASNIANSKFTHNHVHRETSQLLTSSAGVWIGTK